MKIVHVSVSDGGGGAARAADRLHRGLRGLGVDSEMLVASKTSADSHVRAFVPPRELPRRVARLARRRWLGREAGYFMPPGGFEIFSTDRSVLGGCLAEQIGTADVVNLHWVANFFDYRRLFRLLPRHVPIIWTLHDMNPFTGGCHYDAGYGRFASRCGSCPQLNSTPENDLSRRVWQRKRRAFDGLAERRLTIVSPSRWLADECRRSTLLGGRPIEVIPYGLDTETFRPGDRSAVRAGLEIPQDAWVVLFAAQSLTTPRKGFGLLLEALDRLRDVPRLFLLAVGAGDPPLPADIPAKLLPATADDRRLASIYQCADVFVIPSMQDNLPNTVMEAMACGTPVAAFDVGGISDMVRSGETGSLAPPGDAEGLADAIRRLANDEPYRRLLGVRCRRVAEDDYPLHRQAERYSELYQRLITDEVRSGTATQRRGNPSPADR